MRLTPPNDRSTISNRVCSTLVTESLAALTTHDDRTSTSEEYTAVWPILNSENRVLFEIDASQTPARHFYGARKTKLRCTTHPPRPATSHQLHTATTMHMPKSHCPHSTFCLGHTQAATTRHISLRTLYAHRPCPKHLARVPGLPPSPCRAAYGHARSPAIREPRECATLKLCACIASQAPAARGSSSLVSSAWRGSLLAWPGAAPVSATSTPHPWAAH